MIGLSFLAVVSAIGACIAATGAVETATGEDGKPGHEFVSKQLTMGAWALACVLVASLATIGVTQILRYDDLNCEIEVVE